MKTSKQNLLRICVLTLLATGIFGCAGSGSGHSSENFKTQDLNSCARIGDNQRDIDKLQTHIDGLNKKKNNGNENNVSMEIRLSEEQIRSINSANAIQVQNCQPVVLDRSQ